MLSISPVEASFEHRGFVGGAAPVRLHLERVGATFIRGYQAALEADSWVRLEASLASIDAEMRGFGYEGAAMHLSLLDALTPWRRDRFETFLRELAEPYVHLAMAGAGLAAARLPWRRADLLTRRHPLLGWLAVDGFGFHQGFFCSAEAVRQRSVPRRIRGSALQAFDQGLGRSLWFVEVGVPSRVAATIDSFPAPRRGDLWSGIGLASCYAGGADAPALELLRELAGPYLTHLAQGAAFAAKARHQAGYVPEHTESSCYLFTGVSSREAAQLTDDTLGDGSGGGSREQRAAAYEAWRRKIRHQLAPPRRDTGRYACLG